MDTESALGRRPEGRERGIWEVSMTIIMDVWRTLGLFQREALKERQRRHAKCPHDDLYKMRFRRTSSHAIRLHFQARSVSPKQLNSTRKKGDNTIIGINYYTANQYGGVKTNLENTPFPPDCFCHSVTWERVDGFLAQWKEQRTAFCTVDLFTTKEKRNVLSIGQKDLATPFLRLNSWTWTLPFKWRLRVTQRTFTWFARRYTTALPYQSRDLRYCSIAGDATMTPLFRYAWLLLSIFSNLLPQQSKDRLSGFGASDRTSNKPQGRRVGKVNYRDVQYL